MALTERRFREIFSLTEQFIESRYGVEVSVTDVPKPFTGDLDGAQIYVDHDNSPEDAVFILVHLFGHTVQWNLSAQDRELGMRVESRPSPDRLIALENYEREACRYSLTLVHTIGIFDLDQWLSDFARCDFAFLKYFYLTGSKRAFRTFWMEGQPLLLPLAVPVFMPTRWTTRSGGIVIG